MVVVAAVVVTASAVVLLSALKEEDAEEMEEKEEEEDDDDEFFGVLLRVSLFLWPPKICSRWTALLAANFSQNFSWYLLSINQ